MIAHICQSPKSPNGSRRMSICQRFEDRVVLELAIRDAVGKLDPDFGYADHFDDASGSLRQSALGEVAAGIYAWTQRS